VNGGLANLARYVAALANRAVGLGGGGKGLDGFELRIAVTAHKLVQGHFADSTNEPACCRENWLATNRRCTFPISLSAHYTRRLDCRPCLALPTQCFGTRKHDAIECRSICTSAVTVESRLVQMQSSFGTEHLHRQSHSQAVFLHRRGLLRIMMQMDLGKQFRS